MDWIQVLTIIISLLGSLYYLHGELKEFKREIREDMQAQTNRTDKLYEMFYELLKEGRK